MAQQKVDGPQEPLRRTQAAQRYKVAAVYAVTAWLLIQTAVVLDTSTGLMTAIIVLLALGFAMAIYISWTFEATPEGMKRTEKRSARRGPPDLESPQVCRPHYYYRSARGQPACFRSPPD